MIRSALGSFQMTTYKLHARSVVLPHVLLDLFVMYDQNREVVQCWSEEGGTYPLQDGERKRLRDAVLDPTVLYHALSRISPA